MGPSVDASAALMHLSLSLSLSGPSSAAGLTAERRRVESPLVGRTAPCSSHRPRAVSSRARVRAGLLGVRLRWTSRSRSGVLCSKTGTGVAVPHGGDGDPSQAGRNFSCRPSREAGFRPDENVRPCLLNEMT
jgi:hypothetical protein